MVTRERLDELINGYIKDSKVITLTTEVEETAYHEDFHADIKEEVKYMKKIETPIVDPPKAIGQEIEREFEISPYSLEQVSTFDSAHTRHFADPNAHKGAQDYADRLILNDAKSCFSHNYFSYLANHIGQVSKRRKDLGKGESIPEISCRVLKDNTITSYTKNQLAIEIIAQCAAGEIVRADLSLSNIIASQLVNNNGYFVLTSVLEKGGIPTNRIVDPEKNAGWFNKYCFGVGCGIPFLAGIGAIAYMASPGLRESLPIPPKEAAIAAGIWFSTTAAMTALGNHFKNKHLLLMDNQNISTISDYLDYCAKFAERSHKVTI